MNRRLAEVEAILFTSGTAVSKKRLATLVHCNSEQLEAILTELTEKYKEGGMSVLDDGANVALAVNSEVLDSIKKIQKEEIASSLSKASQETLSIIAYAGPITKTDLDFLRGVNTQYAVRRLAMRGLIHEVSGKQQRQYALTVASLHHLGIQKIEELPEYSKIRNAIVEGIQTTKKKMKDENEV